ncbi:BrnA antitoxin family protein [Peteryoungia desertarenae]|uniref:BrnA antitoxin family protein n=1 Tax=Peteryoungia desertarenae TaxID=1813451 RepID=A0ABX6QMR0_9HYPH|nr:BrnA antitoxin family protein [Peteryoungia desertarenae]QLF69774.1 BrnA antitoxin family protein [Peteryoungia desertarenae]
MSGKFSSKRPLTDEEEAEIQAMIAADPDNPEVTDEELKEFRPFREVFPDLAEAIDRRLGRPKAESPKKAISIRLDQEVIDRFKATGDGWQSRMNEALRKAVGL